MRREREGSVVFNGGRLAVPGKRRLGMAIFALLVTLFVFGLLSDSAWAQNANLVVTKEGPTTVAAGQNFSYELTVRNQGIGAADDTVLIDRLPAGK